MANERPGRRSDDELIDQARRIVRDQQRASTSNLQRQLEIGYHQANRLMDRLEAEGTVVPFLGQ